MTRMNPKSSRSAPFLFNGTAVAAALAATLLAGCGGGHSTPSGSTQVAAQVNQGEISIHQVNLVLQRQPNLQADQVDAAGQVALDRLVQLELALQKATEAKLDRDPQVVQALDLARREVLARAYIDRLAASVSKPTPQEVEAFYAQRAALFKERRIYAVQEINVLAPATAVPALQARLQSARTVGSVLAELGSSGLAYSLNSAKRPAEEWPMAQLDQLAAMREGDVRVLPQPQGLRVVVLTQVSSEPRTLDQARAGIERFLLNERRQQKVESELKALRKTADVKYLGKFVQAGGTAAADAGGAEPTAPAAPAPTAGASVSAPAASAGATRAPTLDADARSNGIQGLR